MLTTLLAIARPMAARSHAPPLVAETTTAQSAATTKAVRWNYIWADNVNVRSCYRLHCAPVPRSTTAGIRTCTIDGDRVTYGPCTNVYWTRISVDLDGGDGYYEEWGFVSDVFVSGGANNQPAGSHPSFDCFNT